MNLFDKLVSEALEQKPNLASLRVVVEKELLHHDILKTLSQNDLLVDLTFIGGTCLRSCYGGIRLSEDLDFTGGGNFSRQNLSHMGKIISQSLNEKYGLAVIVTEPKKDIKNVDTWKIKVETRPKQSHMPKQRINIDICKVPSYEKRPMMLLNPYGVDMGTSGLIVQVESREEIYADKLLAFALRPNRLKYRDLWDIAWLHQQGITPRFELIPNKLLDHGYTKKTFLERYRKRQISLVEQVGLSLEFEKEMYRFLPVEQVNEVIKQGAFWQFITYLVNDLGKQLNTV